MHFFRRVEFYRPTCVAAAALACVVISGCVSAVGQRWADFTGDKAVEAADADDSFPSAREVGLANSQSSTKSR